MSSAAVGARPILCGDARTARHVFKVVGGLVADLYMQREHSANIKDAPKPYQQSQTPSVIIELDCRGLEFVEFSPEGEWAAQGEESGTPFVGIDLQEGDWYDFDEKASREVSITELKWDIRRV
jgi:hypothetical protein